MKGEDGENNDDVEKTESSEIVWERPLFANVCTVAIIYLWYSANRQMDLLEISNQSQKKLQVQVFGHVRDNIFISTYVSWGLPLLQFWLATTTQLYHFDQSDDINASCRRTSSFPRREKWPRRPEILKILYHKPSPWKQHGQRISACADRINKQDYYNSLSQDTVIHNTPRFVFLHINSVSFTSRKLRYIHWFRYPTETPSRHFRVNSFCLSRKWEIKYRLAHLSLAHFQTFSFFLWFASTPFLKPSTKSWCLLTMASLTPWPCSLVSISFHEGSMSFETSIMPSLFTPTCARCLKESGAGEEIINRLMDKGCDLLWPFLCVLLLGNSRTRTSSVV